MSPTRASPNFDLDLKFGQERENELQEILHNEPIEVKCDRLCIKTGNVFVEFEDAGRPSGISITKSKFYCFAIAMICGGALVEAPIAEAVTIAFLNASIVIISDGFKSSFTISTHLNPVS